MKFKLPKKFKMLGKTIKVKVVNTQEFMGLWDPTVNVIYIAVNQSEKSLEETFWHEYTHCEQWLTALNQALPRELLETMAEMRSRMLPEAIREFYKK